jgi:hypothetical protein
LIPDGTDFENDGDMATAWRRYRAAILAEFARPGQRPFGFYRFDLRLDKAPCHWYHEVRILHSNGLLDATELVAVESEHMLLSPAQPTELYASFEDPARIKAMGFCGHTLRQLEAEFLLAVDWHGWRERPELVDRYLRRAAVIHDFCGVACV